MTKEKRRAYQAVFISKLITWILYSVSILLLYIPEQFNINILPFYINNIGNASLWYYMILFCMMVSIIFVRYKTLQKYNISDHLSFYKLLSIDSVTALVSIPFWFEYQYNTIGIILLGYSVLVGIIDRHLYPHTNFGTLVRYVGFVSVFTVISMCIIFWQKNIERLSTTSGIMEYCVANDDWNIYSDNWSVAQYTKDGMLVKSVGEYKYVSYIDFSELAPKDVVRRNIYDTEHYVFSVGDYVYIVSQNSWSDSFCFFVNVTFITFIYLLISFSLYAALMVWKKKWSLKRSFFARIRYSIVFYLLGSMILTLSLSVIFINYKYVKNAKRSQESRMLFLVQYLEHYFTDEFTDEELYEEIGKMSVLHSTDIMLFDKNGNLIMNTNPNPSDAEKDFTLDKGTHRILSSVHAFTIYDKENKALKISTFGSLLDKTGEPVYIIMSSSSEMTRLANEISYFLVMIINLYLILTIIGVLVGYYITDHLAWPLREIEEKMQTVSLNGKIQKINYKYENNDELTQFIDNYNNMVDQLENLATKLTLDERERSWRNIARQIAHEIKNPLTPMRLIVQKMMVLNEPDCEIYKKKIDKFTSILLNEIDNLYNTTDSLSDFAKAPTLFPVKLNIVEQVKHVVELFENNNNDVEIEFSSDIEEALVLTDKDMIIRVFVNLIKNAIQAIPSDKKGVIIVKVYVEDKYAVVSVKDNGTGIPDDIKEHIFTANFSTRTQGMGLGLSLVKNVIDASEGSIEFETEINVGTEFVVKLPLVDTDRTERQADRHL